MESNDDIPIVQRRRGLSKPRKTKAKRRDQARPVPLMGPFECSFVELPALLFPIWQDLDFCCC